MSNVPASIGRYEVERLLGEGGMGLLYLARDPVLDRQVALKLLRVNGEELRRRFMREAQSAGRLQHPNIVTVYDVGDHEGELYIAMEYIDGDTLGTLIRDDAPFSAVRKLDIIDDIADGLDFAHRRGIIHRDIKPANLMMSRGGLVKVLDFGIARVGHRDSVAIDASTLIGTPAYMAPEQLEGSAGDARSDIYAAGLVMYEFFSGRRAFFGATTAEVLQKVLDSQPTPIQQLVPEIDPDLARIIARAMARQPGDRYPDLQAMRKDLARAKRRALQASGDDATIVVGQPGTRPVWQGAPTPSAAAGGRITTNPALPTPQPAPPPTPALIMFPPTAVDRGLAHLATQRSSGTRPRAGAQSAVFTPAPAVGSAAAPSATPPVGVSVTGPIPESVLAVVPPPLPIAMPRAAPDGSTTRATVAHPDEGPFPIALPAVRSSGVIPSATSGRATVEAPVVSTARYAFDPVPVGAPVIGADVRAASPPRMAATAAPAPVAAPGVVQSSPGPGVPTTRRGIPAAFIVGGLIAMLGMCFVIAFLAVRSFGLLSGVSRPGLFTRTVDPKVTDPSARPPSTPASSTDTAPVTTPPVTTPRATEVAVAPPPQAPVEPPVTTAPPRAVQEPRSATRPTLPQPPARVPAQRSSPPARQTPPARKEPVAPPRSVLPMTRDVAPPAVVEALPPPVPHTEPDPPPLVAPTDEGMALVRAYVAARNTAHASNIRRVWPDVDDNHLRRITSAFSAPLTLVGCDIEARDTGHATATCRLTQVSTTGTYAAAQGLAIRRNFVFDLLRQGRTWVIAGLRE